MFRKNKPNGHVSISAPKDGFTEEEIQIISFLASKVNKTKVFVNINRLFLPMAYPFSDFDLEDKPEQFGDNNQAETKMYSNITANVSVIKILSNLEDQHKIVFMFLLLRESGFNLTHEECARILSISRQSYMKLAKNVKIKAGKLIQDLI